MTKELMRDSMVQRYNAGAFTHNYILCFARKKMVYAVEVRNAESLIPQVVFAEKRGSQYVLRYRPTKAQQELILSRASRVEIICSIEYLEAEKVNHNNNRGDCVEDLVAIRWKGTQPELRTAKFTETGDVISNGIHYQVKYGASTGAATFTNEQTLHNLGL